VAEDEELMKATTVGMERRSPASYNEEYPLTVLALNCRLASTPLSQVLLWDELYSPPQIFVENLTSEHDYILKLL
jgi:hypothetical protein